MTAKSWPAAVNSLILIAVLFAAWQLLFEFAGSQAMTAPVEAEAALTVNDASP